MPSDFAITRLSTTPVKGLALHHPESIELTRDGAIGDRRFYLVDDTGRLQSCARNPELFGLTAAYDRATRRLEISRDGQVLLAGVIEPDRTVQTDLWGVRTITSDVVADPAWSEFFSDLLGRRVHLLQARTSAYDVSPVTLLGSGSVARLSQHVGSPVDSRRFRMLIEFTSDDPHVEDSWDGRILHVGEAVLRGGGPVHRCAATTRDPDSGAVDLQTLRLITEYRGRQDSLFGIGANFGAYADVVEAGRVSVGDRIQLATAGLPA